MHKTQHRNKRPYQPAITSFFAHDTTSDDHPRGPTRKPTLALAPPVPLHVQSELLHVGMRVRKSVPEGYKATSPNKCARLPSIQTTLSRPSTTTITLDPVAPSALHARELLPFSGLHKTPSYADQPMTNIHLYTPELEQPDSTTFFPLPAEAFSQPFFSSLDSGYDSTPSLHPGKRSWHDEQDLSSSGFLFGKRGVKVEVEEVPVSPLSESPGEVVPRERMVRVPKSRRRVGDVGGSGDAIMNGDAAVAEFEEAEFLGEVCMGGV
jgi:hypothetical protein